MNMNDDDDLKTNAAEIIKAARQGHDAKILDVAEGAVDLFVPMLVLPDGYGGLVAHSVKDEIDKYRERPERREGTARLEDLSSFVAHANRFKDADSAIFISGDPARPSFLSVLDYHERANVEVPGKVAPDALATAAQGRTSGVQSPATTEHRAEALPRFGRHRGSYLPVFSTEWQAWKDASGKALSQAEFAALIQTRARDIYDVDTDDIETGRLGDLASWFAKRFARGLDPAEFYGSSQKMLELSEGLTATITDRVGDVQKYAAGATKITFESERSTDVEIPAAFVIEVPVFRGGDLWQLPVRLRYTVRSVADTKRAEWRVEVFGAERTVADVVKDMGETVAKGTGLPVFVGSPET